MESPVIDYDVTQRDAVSDSLDMMEGQIPGLSEEAVMAAYQQALSTGQRVLVSGENGIYRAYPDGSRELVKPLDDRLSVPVGTRVKIR